jgi:hypothetical protein
MKKGDEQVGLVLRMDGTTERFTWRLGDRTLAQWQALIPDMTFTGAHLDTFGVYMLSDDEGKLRSDWPERLNMPATVLYGNNYGLPLCDPNVMISGDVLVIGQKTYGDGASTGLLPRQVELIEKLASHVRGKRHPAQAPINQIAEEHGTFVIEI